VKITFQCVILCLVLALSQETFAQKSAGKATYIVVIGQKNGTSTKGVLHSITPEAIDIINFHDSIVHIVVPAAEVSSIRYRKQGRIGRHVGWGALIGGVTGFVVGLATYDAHPCGFTTCVERGIDPLSTLMIGALAGGATGVITGSRFKEIPLDGDPKKYEAAVFFFENPKP